VSNSLYCIQRISYSTGKGLGDMSDNGIKQQGVNFVPQMLLQLVETAHLLES
jgi:hypothetical protein